MLARLLAPSHLAEPIHGSMGRLGRTETAARLGSERGTLPTGPWDVVSYEDYTWRSSTTTGSLRGL